MDSDTNPPEQADELIPDRADHVADVDDADGTDGTAEDATASLWQRAIEGGQSMVRGVIGQLPFFGSLTAVVDGDEPVDQHHYFLVPTPHVEPGHVVVELHCLPQGYTAADALPVRRYFHLAGKGEQSRLESLILDEALPTDIPQADLSARLHRIADEIDRHSANATGGLLVIGSVVAVFQPLVGAGIAAKALFPSLGAMFGREGLRFLADKWQGLRNSQVQRVARKEALSELHAQPVELVVNPVLRTLARAIETSVEEFDPLVHGAFDQLSADDPSLRRHAMLGAKAVLGIYQHLNVKERKAAGLGPEDERWLEYLQTLTGDDTEE